MVKLSDRDREILVMAWSCFKAPPEVDYKKLQELAGYKTAASATTACCQVKNKLLGKGAGKLSDRDREILVTAWECFKSPPQVDYKKLQEKGGYKTAASATTAYCQVKNKLLNADVKLGLKRKKVDDNREVTETPNKRATKVKADAPVNSGDDIEDDEEEAAQALKKRTKKASAQAVEQLEDASKGSPNCDDEIPKRIKQEPYDKPVDMSLFETAAQLLQDEESAQS